jgi:hypothetical protein
MNDSSARFKEVQIYDRRPGTESQLAPLGELLRHLQQLAPDTLTGRWRVLRGAYAGYGRTVTDIENALVDNEYVDLEAEDLFPILLSDEEYFYNVRIEKVCEDIELGVFDTTYLYLRGPSRLVQEAAKRFKDVVIVEQS